MFEAFFYNEIVGYIFSGIIAFLILTGLCFWITTIWQWLKDRAEFKNVRNG